MTSSSPALPCFVLTAPKGGQARRLSVEFQLKKAGIPYTLITGYAPEDEIIAERYSPWRNLFYMKRSLTPGEVAVYLGHQKMWQAIIDSGAPAGLVFEDDFIFKDPDTIAHVIGQASLGLDRWDLVKLYDIRPRRALAIYRDHGIDFALYRRPNSSLIAYMLTATCCKKLLERRFIFRPVDEELRYWFETRLKIVTVVPNPVDDASESLEGSLLETDRLRLRSRRNIFRSIYGNFITAYINTCCEIWSRWIAWTHK